MTITCTITTSKSQLIGRLKADYPNDTAPIVWSGDVALLKSNKITPGLRPFPKKLNAKIFEICATWIANELGGKIQTQRQGLWKSFDEVITVPVKFRRSQGIPFSPANLALSVQKIQGF